VAGQAEPESYIATAPDGVPIHYTIYGMGSPALILVHGISCDQGYWKEQVVPFSGNYRVVTVDLAGHGASGAGRQDWSMEAYGGDVAAVVRELDLESVILIGHSMGGAVIFKAAEQLPGRVLGLVAVDTFEDFSSWYTPEQNESYVNPFREDYRAATRTFVEGMFVDGTDPSWIEQIVTDMQASPPAVMIPSLESALALMYGQEVATLLPGLDVPVVVINSDLGPTKIDSMKRDGVEVHIIEGTGHFLILEDPQVFNSILNEVIESISD
jgi:pimeloyl-ACP methyl ester carboxylesterase